MIILTHRATVKRTQRMGATDVNGEPETETVTVATLECLFAPQAVRLDEDTARIAARETASVLLRENADVKPLDTLDTIVLYPVNSEVAEGTWRVLGVRKLPYLQHKEATVERIGQQV